MRTGHALSLQYKDFAILVRSNDQAIPFIKSLNMLGIPWQFSGNQGLYKREEIRLLLSFLRVMANPADSISLYFLLTSHLYSFDPVELAQINHVASYNRRSLMDVLRSTDKYKELENLPEATIGLIEKCLNEINEFYEIAQHKRAGEVLYLFLKQTKILERLYNSTSQAEIEQAQNIAKFFKIVEKFSNVTNYDRVIGFVEHINSLLSAGDDPTAAEMDAELDAVNVLTIHKAKGLEYPIVFMVSLVEDRFPSRNRRDSIELPDGIIKDILPTGDFHVQEERRLFYVGMTRAKRELYLTNALDYGGKRAKKISRFVLEALDKPQADVSAFKSSIKETIERFAPAPEHVDSRLTLPGTEGVLKLSPYAIDDYLTCPLKYKYVNILRVPVLRNHTLVFGEVVHRVLNEYYKAKKDGKSFAEKDLLRLYKNFWSSAGFVHREHEDERYRSGKEMLVRYFHSQEEIDIVPFSVEEDFKFIIKYQDPSASLQDDKNSACNSERSVAFKEGAESGKICEKIRENPCQIKVKGRWDRLDIRGKENIIVDFKTTGRVKDQKAADKEIKQSRQLIIYAMGHRNKYGKLPDYVELHFLEPNIISQLKPTQKMVDKIEQEIQTVAEGIKSRDFRAKPAFMACQFCAYSNICPAQERG